MFPPGKNSQLDSLGPSSKLSITTGGLCKELPSMMRSSITQTSSFFPERHNIVEIITHWFFLQVREAWRKCGKEMDKRCEESTDYVNFNVQPHNVSTHRCCKAARVWSGWRWSERWLAVAGGGTECLWKLGSKTHPTWASWSLHSQSTAAALNGSALEHLHPHDKLLQVHPYKNTISESKTQVYQEEIVSYVSPLVINLKENWM